MMKNRLFKSILACVLWCCGVFVFALMPENVAKGKMASASGVENNIYMPKLAVDGITNRDKGGREQSRWTSNVVSDKDVKNGKWSAPDEKSIIWFQVDLGEIKSGLRDVVIEWEFAKAINYSIEMSDDGSTWRTVWQGKSKSSTPSEYIRLEKAESARYVKLLVRQFEKQSWGAISIYEFQVFNGMLPENIDTLARRFNASMIDTSGDKLKYKLPEELNNVSIKILGSNFKQVVSMDGEIFHPLSEKKVLVTFELSADGKTAQTEAIPVVFKGIATPVANANLKPAVIPALQEWNGTTGNWNVSDKIDLWVESKTTGQFYKMMKIFAADYQKQTGKTIKIASPSTKESACPIISIRVLKESEKLITEHKQLIKKLGKEGYSIKIGKDFVDVVAATPTGAFWATRTILQILKNNNNQSLPCGEICDYPQYPVRGFMFDVGRKPVSIEMIQNVMKMMSWYKMNDLQLHLNDNFIWLHDYAKTPNDRKATDAQKKIAGLEVLDAAPTAFRLESNIVGKNGIKLTTESHFYTKKQFGRLIDLGELYGVNIVPELDVPGHAMSFVRVRPDLMYRGKIHKSSDVERVAMLDASTEVFDLATGKTYREETLDFVKKVFDEYLVAEKGKQPVFRNSVVHIGTDEYYGNAEDYRWFADALLKHIKSRGFTPRLWGSLHAKRGETSVVSEGVQMHIWSRDWERPSSAINAGYDIINILDADMYIVPNGRGGTGAYNDYISLPNLYNPRWQPNVMQQYKVIPGHPRMLGAQFALWNDNSWRRDTGLVDYDLYDRIEKTASVLAEKTWNMGVDRNFDSFIKLYEEIGTYPSINPRFQVKTKTDVILNLDFSSDKILDKSGNDYHAEKTKGVKFVKNGYASKNVAVQLKKNSFIKMPIDNVAPNYVVEFMICRKSDKNDEQILFSSSTGQFKAVQKLTGQIGITRETWDYSFDYTLPVDKWVKVKLEAKDRQLTLFVDDKKIGGPKRHQFPNSHKYSTFIFPIEYIGSAKNGFDGLIDDLKIIKK